MQNCRLQLQMNYCKECITKKLKQTVEKCPECKQNTLLVENGFAKCNNCGFGRASTPEFEKCVTKNKYIISVDKRYKPLFTYIKTLGY